MGSRDQIALSIPEAELASIREALARLNALLVPHLARLTPQDRQEIPKMGDRTVGFVLKALDYARLNPELVPSFLDVGDLVVDLEAVRVLREFQRTLAPLVEALDDSILLSGSEAYQAALVFYTNVKTAARANQRNAAVVYDDLSSQFPGRPPKKR